MREKVLQITNVCFYRAMFNQFYSYNSVYGVKLVKFIFILDIFPLFQQLTWLYEHSCLPQYLVVPGQVSVCWVYSKLLLHKFQPLRYVRYNKAKPLLFSRQLINFYFIKSSYQPQQVRSQQSTKFVPINSPSYDSMIAMITNHFDHYSLWQYRTWVYSY